MSEKETTPETLRENDLVPEVLPETEMTSDSGQKETTPEAFARFLYWLSPDPKVAAQKYEEFRRRLTKSFRYYGFHEADTLADETLERATRKFIDTAIPPRAPVAAYLLNIAQKVRLEQLREPPIIELSALLTELLTTATQPSSARDPETCSVCLATCLTELTPTDRNLLIKYHQGQGQHVSQNRKDLADQHNITLPVLRSRVMRWRQSMRTCLEKCLAQQKK